LRYIPDPEGERFKNGKRYSKVDSEEAYSFLKENYPYYLYDCENTRVQMMGVPLNKVKEIIRPDERLQEIRNQFLNENDNEKSGNDLSDDSLLKKVIKVADTFHEGAGIPYQNMGISGSILPGLYDPENSDVDFVIYGLAYHRIAMNLFGQIKDTPEYQSFRSIGDDYWRKVYDKRIKDSTLSFEEFCWYEKRKNNRGVVDGTLFDILATREWNEISGTWGDTTYQPLGQMTVECTVSNALASFDNPAVYEVQDVEIVDINLTSPPSNRVSTPNISEIASFTHTYSGQAREGERIVAQGKLEKVINQKESYRIVVGTTRESLNEFIKLKINPLIK
jgi:predicted nucleotidyltransferase